MKFLIWNRLLINNNIKMVPPTLDPSEKIKGMEKEFLSVKDMNKMAIGEIISVTGKLR